MKLNRVTSSSLESKIPHTTTYKKETDYVQYTLDFRLHIRYVSSNSSNRGNNGTSSINVLLYNSYEDGATSYQILDKDTPDTMMMLTYDMSLSL